MPAPVSLAVMLVLATFGAILGVVVRGDRSMWGDVAILEAVQRTSVPGLDSLVRISNAAFSTEGALVLAAIVIGIALVLRHAWFAWQMAIVIVLRLAGQVLKPIFDSPRPGIEYQPDPSLVSDSLGYPSGHAYTATIFACMLTLFALGLDIPRWARWAISAGSIAAAVIALFSRIHIGAHWPSDTFGGVFFGVATFALMQLIVLLVVTRSSSTASTQARSPYPG